MENQVNDHASFLFKIKDSGIFLGVLYVIALILMLPVYLYYFDNTISIITFTLLGLLVILIVHLVLNWLYYLVIIIPLLMSVLLFVLGWAIFILSPLFQTYITFLLDMADTFMSMVGLSLPSNFIDPLFKFFDRIAEFLIVISGISWWLINKGKNINYKALAFYLVFIAFAGVLIGFGSMVNVFFILFIWYLIYLKVNNVNDRKEFANLAILFKIGATAMIISGVVGVDVIGSGIETTMVFAGDENTIYKNFALIYPKIIGILLLIGVWKPSLFNKVPKLSEFVKWMRNKGKYLLKWAL
ncbi:hypothetical protein [Tenuibacillus multivorans]|uniref:Uncharacterized protein n=1 Tax=Tenuibacillus multivorans TaxID=237069 RepID=A0A1H0BMU6_9BACI|nr:hypothetical protein [Tenuibacillus multivorans]GEL77103.1 hypothetical protein TMU01_13380 [Tenuibacillus multivorans]SDN46969.1 hypothetical protein SAMN05216498_2317 [Tenuibacillus multivorans]